MKQRMKPQLCVPSDASDDYLRYLKQMNLSHCFVMFTKEDSFDESRVNQVLDRVRAVGLTIDDAGSNFLYKHPSIPLGLPDRDEWIERYNNLNRWLGDAGVPVGYANWDAGRVETSWWKVGEHTHGSVARIVDMDEINARPVMFDRVYEAEELWENFEYFLKAVLPVCKEANIKLAMHPNDPPTPMYEGCASLIHSADCYRRAIALADSIEPGYLGLKFCCGCWLEGGTAFGNVLDDLREFIRQGKVYTIHFRNVSGTIPYFEETLLEDGYMDMYKIMRLLVEENYTGGIYVDHVLRYDEATGGTMTSFAYATGYTKGLMNAAYTELKC